MADLLMNTIKAKRNLNRIYSDLCDAVDEFEEKWDEKGVHISSEAQIRDELMRWRSCTGPGSRFAGCAEKKTLRRRASAGRTTSVLYCLRALEDR